MRKIMLCLISFVVLPNFSLSIETPLNYVAGFGEMEYIDRYYYNRKPIPRDTLFPNIVLSMRVFFYGDDTIKPYVKAFVDRQDFSSGKGSQFIYFNRSGSDNKNRTITFMLPSLDTFRTKQNYPRFVDSIEILFDIKIDSINNVSVVLFTQVNNFTIVIDTIRYNTNWRTIKYSLKMRDTIWIIRPHVRLIVNKDGQNKIKLWMDNLRIYSKIKNEYTTLPRFRKSNLKLVSLHGPPKGMDWITDLAMHDMFRLDLPNIVPYKTLKPEALFSHYVMTSAAVVLCRRVGADTICDKPTNFLGLGDLYPYSYINDSLAWCFITDKNGKRVGHWWKYDDNNFQFEPFVRFGNDGEVCRNVFYRNLKWIYDSAYTYIKPDNIFLDNCAHVVFMIPDSSPDYENRPIRKAKHLDFIANLKNRTGISLLGNMGFDTLYNPYLDAYFVCGFTAACEYGAGIYVNPKTTYDIIKFITKYPEKIYMIAAGVKDEQQLLYTVSAFYIVSNENTYFIIHDTSDKRQCQYRCPIYPKYYYLPIGKPEGKYEVYSYSDTSRGFVFLKRNFTDGIVFLNLDTLNSYSYTIDRNYLDHNFVLHRKGEKIIVPPRSGYILFSPYIQVPIDTNESLKVMVRKNKIIIENLSKNKYDFSIYNASGRLLHSGKLSEYDIFDIKLRSGVYVIKLKEKIYRVSVF
ncbi:MAG: T9SS type A sorting domain-containing protein [candidate division WOR-3 bacterium]|nr:T9SS type A sorting domain-containing protein [candidate division WOR-3 bacterium]MDW8150931.1 T9SS type A sorting domain-containing protein [candidate division WOR-3 bacterium]